MVDDEAPVPLKIRKYSAHSGVKKVKDWTSQQQPTVAIKPNAKYASEHSKCPPRARQVYYARTERTEKEEADGGEGCAFGRRCGFAWLLGARRSTRSRLGVGHWDPLLGLGRGKRRLRKVVRARQRRKRAMAMKRERKVWKWMGWEEGVWGERRTGS
ncbi:hypothetical protein FA13DRAFT_681165 [Coprinellus micaceus]|uniref:Uncharacterized protein n=1 Tax=Coprinellus micaceus TaxID=71717 RepID=A0A4Y7T4Q3_COPMI|nr:hypothetical protein FA13DRAFT_681165 [Coprinellus micaceus]